MPHGSFSNPGAYTGRKLTPRYNYDARFNRFSKWHKNYIEEPRGNTDWDQSEREYRTRTAYRKCFRDTQNALYMVHGLENAGIRHGRNGTVAPITGRSTYHNQLRLIRARDWYAFKHRCQTLAFDRLSDSLWDYYTRSLMNPYSVIAEGKYESIVNGPY